jgi:hypothetical protein
MSFDLLEHGLMLQTDLVDQIFRNGQQKAQSFPNAFAEGHLGIFLIVARGVRNFDDPSFPDGSLDNDVGVKIKLLAQVF